MKIDIANQQPQNVKYPLVGEDLSDLGFLVPDHNGYLVADSDEVNDSALKHGGSFEQIEDEDGNEKFQLVF